MMGGPFSHSDSAFKISFKDEYMVSIAMAVILSFQKTKNRHQQKHGSPSKKVICSFQNYKLINMLSSFQINYFY